MSRVPCYVVTEITAGEPVGTHIFSLDEDGLDEMCDTVATMIEEQTTSVVLANDIEREISKYSCYRFKGTRSNDWAIHVHKSTKGL